MILWSTCKNNLVFLSFLLYSFVVTNRLKETKEEDTRYLYTRKVRVMNDVIVVKFYTISILN